MRLFTQHLQLTLQQSQNLKTMRNILVIAFVLLSAGLFAQTVGNKTAWVADTTTNTETEYLVLASPVAIQYDRLVTLTAWGTNASGTATVLATPQGSDDNSKWYDLATADTLNNAGTVTNVDYNATHAYYLYYRWKLVSSGTGVTYLGGGITTKRLN